MTDLSALAAPSIEATAPDFDPAKLLAVQAKTFAALREIARTFKPGMLESDALAFTARRLVELGFEKSWHPPYVRFGPNTCLIYGKASAPETRLRKDDIFFLDVGTVLDGYEGDAGDTFVVGDDLRLERCAEEARALWEKCRDAWRDRKLQGPALYAYAQDQAAAMGWTLNPGFAGHRISEFPHHAHYRGSLAGAPLCPAPGLWVLEIHLCEPGGRFGAFYEDLLA